MPVHSYDVIQEYGYSPNSEVDEVSINPTWLMCVFRLQSPYLYDAALHASFSSDYSKAVLIRGGPLLIENDCTQISVSSDKSSHIMNLSATLVSSGLNYITEIFPEDYVFAWMFNNPEAAEEVKRQIKDGWPCNQFMDGLKFIGRVNTIHKRLIQQSDGRRVLRYSLSAAGFGELDSTIFYEEHLALIEPAIGQYFARLGIALNEIVRSDGGGIDINKVIPYCFDLLLGRGVPANNGQGTAVPENMRTTAGTEAPYGYIVPFQVGALLDKATKSQTLLTFADTVEMVYGIQRYDNAVSVDPGLDDEMEFRTPLPPPEVAIFSPDGTRGNGSRRWTGYSMMGTILPVAPQFSGKSVWSILYGMLNPSVNEMYMTLRCNGQGNVVPTITVRQLPFSTPQAKENTGLVVTPFLDLPRWKIHSSMVKNYDIGRSDSMRINFIHVYGEPGPANIEGADYTYQIIKNRPARNDLDIARSGLRPHMATVQCAPKDRLGNTPGEWIALLADFQMGLHLTLTGSLELTGIQAPICIGDNLEWDGVVYHIESVAHSCSIEGDGRKTFSTSLALTNGVAANPVDGRLGLYACTKPEDQTQYNPGITSDTDDSSSAPAVQTGAFAPGTQFEDVTTEKKDPQDIPPVTKSGYGAA